MAAKQMGITYIAITEHSRHLTVTHGLDEKRLLQQIEEIDPLNQRLKGITVLKAIEDFPGFFKAGICLFGVSNQFTLAAETHKFEAHYSDSLLGPLPGGLGNLP